MQSKPGSREITRACNNLNRQGFETFLPWLWKRSPAKAERKVPFFEYYFFVVAREQWRAINSTPGVWRLVTVCGEPGVIKSSIVEGLQRQQKASHGAIRLREVLPRRWSVGEKLTLIGGPFAFRGYEGVVDATPKGRVRLLLTVLGRKTILTVDDDDLSR